jgi:hypothetical protein
MKSRQLRKPFGQTSTNATIARPAQPLRALKMSLEIIGSSCLLIILIGQPLGLFNSCACHPWRKRVDKSDFLVPELGDTFSQLANPYSFTKAQVKATVLGCLPLLLVLYAVYAWCTQSVLSSSGYAKAMSGLQRVRRMQYVLCGEWCAGAIRAARQDCRRSSRSAADATAEGAREQDAEIYGVGEWMLALRCQSQSSRADNGSTHRRQHQATTALYCALNEPGR